MTPFQYGEWKLFVAIDALMAYDGGATDSGVSDPGLRSAVRSYLASLDERTYRHACAIIARAFLTDEAVAGGYGIEDVVRFAEWLDELLREEPAASHV